MSERTNRQKISLLLEVQPSDGRTSDLSRTKEFLIVLRVSEQFSLV